MAANLLLLTLNSFKALFCAPQVLLILLTGNKDFFFFFFPTKWKIFQDNNNKNYEKWTRDILLPSQLAAWAEGSKPDLKGSRRLEKQEKAGKGNAEDGNISEKPGHTQGWDPSREEDGERGGSPAPEHGSPEQCPPVPAARHLLPEAGREGGEWGEKRLRGSLGWEDRGALGV